MIKSIQIHKKIFTINSNLVILIGNNGAGKTLTLDTLSNTPKTVHYKTNRFNEPLIVSKKIEKIVKELLFNILYKENLSNGEKYLFNLFADIYSKKDIDNVLIDEVDLFLDNNYKTIILEKLVTIFPNLSFIVTTINPLVCRYEKAEILYLYKEDNDFFCRKIEGNEKDKIIYGNVLDAYSTELFGENISRSSESQRKLIRLAKLNMLHTIGKITKQEKEEMFKLRKIFTT